MNLAHLHLLLNHWPIMGTYIGLVLLLVALFSRSQDIKQAAYALIAFVALVSIPAYLSGNAAADVTKDLKFTTSIVDTHEGAALLALIALEITGVFALIGLWRFTRNPRGSSYEESPLAFAAVLILSIVTALLMTAVGTTGGNIHHPEIIAAQDAPSTIGTMGANFLLSVRYFVIDYSRWVWPLLEDLHFIGLILILGTVGLLNIRVLGFLKPLPVGPLHRLLPLGLVGFLINIITGVMFFIGMPYFYTSNVIFQAKIIAILLAGGNLLLFYCTGTFRKWEKLGPGEDAPMFAKLVAAASIILWVAVVVIGRYIPVGEV